MRFFFIAFVSWIVCLGLIMAYEHTLNMNMKHVLAGLITVTGTFTFLSGIRL